MNRANVEENNNKWVPVSEQLPPEEWVLICVEREHYQKPDVNLGCYDRYRQQWRTRFGRKVDGTVTHWMPRPFPPEDREEA